MEVDKTFGGHTIPHLYENCGVLFSAVLCSCYRICREGNDRGEASLGEMYYNM